MRQTSRCLLLLAAACGEASVAQREFQPSNTADGIRLRARDVEATWRGDGLDVGVYGQSTGILLRTRGMQRAPVVGGCAITGRTIGAVCHRRAERAEGAVTEWWHADASGLEHGFDIHASATRVWRGTVDVEGAAVVVDRDGATLVGAERLRYEQLVAWDADRCSPTPGKPRVRVRPTWSVGGPG